MTRQEIVKLIHESGLRRLEAEVTTLLLPSIRLRAYATHDEVIAVGATKIGGLPDLPPSIGWPTVPDLVDSLNQDLPGGPLCFLAQFDLASLAPLDAEGLLPPGGMLYFFAAPWVPALGYGAEHDIYVRVFHFDGDLTALRRAPVPPIPERLYNEGELFPEGHVYIPCNVEFEAQQTLPDIDTLTHIESVYLSEGEWEKYIDLYKKSGVRREKFNHRLLGYAQLVQGDMPFKAGPGVWRLLLQLDTQPDINLEWQAWGRAYFWIEKQALLARDFSDVWLITQCT